MEHGCDPLRLMRFQDDESDPKEIALVQSHLAGCTSCRRDLEHLRAATMLLKEDLATAVAAADFSDFEDKVFAAIERSQKPSLAERFSFWLRDRLSLPRVALTASAVAVLLLMVWFLKGTGTNPNTDLGPDTQPVAIAPPQAGPAERRVIVDAIEYTGHRTMVYTVARDKTTVIWLYDFEKAAQEHGEGDEL